MSIMNDAIVFQPSWSHSPDPTHSSIQFERLPMLCITLMFIFMHLCFSTKLVFVIKGEKGGAEMVSAFIISLSPEILLGYVWSKSYLPEEKGKKKHCVSRAGLSSLLHGECLALMSCGPRLGQERGDSNPFPPQQRSWGTNKVSRAQRQNVAFL